MKNAPSTITRRRTGLAALTTCDKSKNYHLKLRIKKKRKKNHVYTLDKIVDKSQLRTTGGRVIRVLKSGDEKNLTKFQSKYPRKYFYNCPRVVLLLSLSLSLSAVTERFTQEINALSKLCTGSLNTEIGSWRIVFRRGITNSRSEVSRHNGNGAFPS